jgi:hypothetical protein
MKSNLLISESKKLQETEILSEKKRRILLVIKARWVILASYILFVMSAGFWFYYKSGIPNLFTRWSDES